MLRDIFLIAQPPLLREEGKIRHSNIGPQPLTPVAKIFRNDVKQFSMPKRYTPSVPDELIEQKIYLIRGHKVMLDADLAGLYRVTTGNLNLAVRRNQRRFPQDFMFQLSRDEAQSLLLQNARAKGRGGRRTPPYAFTEQGVAMLSSVLNSERAVEVNITIMRAFVRLRAMLATHAGLARRLDELEQKYDEQFREVFEAIRELMTPEAVPPSRRIGFAKPQTHEE